ncbi:hypothetical protein BASA50_007974 [Batrachochytrium salamandrivorans]|uniref:Uncharacterized protein n=1 Tax=Batrachochytrium salamandrivorans TaxID=1357716 RepID=A0ABQ8F5G7_9FUNG|nr:hypothetical protein BASA62_007114 [Batrachochytrium salamandrivorans]KAH6592598.1 hypothetical protein BASA50_007974 [Batrachochytrium salamandrivorans]
MPAIDVVTLELLPAAVAALALTVVIVVTVAALLTDRQNRVGYIQLSDSDAMDVPAPAPAPVVDQCTMGMGASGSTDSMNSMNSLSSSHEEIGTTTVNPTNCINLTWHQVDQLSRTVLPPTFIEYAIRISAVLVVLALLAAIVVTIVVGTEHPLLLLHAVLWFTYWLCLVSLLHSARFPASAAPRSLAILYLPYIMTQAFVMAHMTLMDLSVDSLFCLQAIAGFLACICFGLDICNPSRNAAIIEKAHVQKRSLPGQETASFLSLITFSWVVPLLKAGREKPLESDDIPHIPQYDHMDQVVQRWKRIRIKGNNVFWDILRMTYKYATFQILVSIVTSALSFSNPFFINRILTWIQTRKQGDGWIWGAFLLLGMLVSSLLMDILNSQINLSGRHWGIQLRSVLVYEVFKKSTRRAGKTGSASKEASGKDDDNSASQGKIVSLMSTDTRHVRNFITDIHSLLIDTPLSIVLSVSGLLFLMGPPALAGLFVLVISGPISGWTLSARYRILKQTRSLQDRRIQATNEALLGIRIIKYMAWEMQFLKKIVAAREDELQSRLKLLINNLCMILIAWGSSILVTFTSFFFYTVVAGKSLDAATAFTSISLLSTVSFNLSSLSEDVSRILNVRVVMARLHAFLTEEELERYHTVDEKVPQGTNSRQASKSTTDESIGFRNAEFSYYSLESNSPASSDLRKHANGAAHDNLSLAAVSGNTEAHTFSLNNISVEFPIGKLTTIIGPTGSGKTSLLLSLLGELKRYQGEVYIPRQTPDAIARGSSQTNLAYVAQTAWLLNATIRDNILFGAPYEEERYSRVVTACALRRDLETFQGGDLTEIGEKGVNLSGGQKQRVSLARAAYSRAQIVLLDDPLSAVDAPTARQLFYECILDLFKGRTVLLVTHAVGLTALQSDHVILLKNGQVFLQGTPLDIIANPDVGTILGKDMESNMPTYETATEDSNDTNGKCAIKSDAKSGKRLTDREGKATGSVKWVTYTAYIVACGGFVFLFFVFLGFFIQTAADFMSNWWIQRWTDNIGTVTPNSTLLMQSQGGSYVSGDSWSFEGRSSLPLDFTSDISHSTVSAYSSMVSTLSPDITMLEQSTKDALFYISIYGLISMIELFSLVFKFVVQFFGGMRASRVMHARLIEAVLGSPMRFFETTPVGRIINRFSTDLSDIDMAVMFTVVRFFTLTCGAVVRIGLVTFVTPPFLFSVVFLYFYYNIAQYYLLTSRELKRIESVSSSPIYAQFGETLNGVSTIRAYGAEDRITQQIQRKVDANHRAYFYLFATNRWLSLRTSVLSEAIVFGAGISIILSGVTAGWAGVAFIFANQFTSMMSRMIQIHSSMEMAMNAVERVEEYSKLPQEPPAIIELFRPPANWPTHGQIEVTDLTIKYAPDLPDALTNVSFSVRPCEKLGVVGRTGAGKSTLSTAFFRILPFVNGTITIDGVDISRLGLRDLRSCLTIIPQDPVLFEGTLRSNLDPLDEHADNKIWEALLHSNLLESLQKPKEKRGAMLVSSDEEDVASGSASPTSSAPALWDGLTNSGTNQKLSLDAHVSENGNNFSQGQKQLLCLARALLRSRRVIFLDEATASVDTDTDVKIQQTIRTQFTDATVLTVAHRLKTVIDYDRVLVMDAGQVAEIGTPYELLEQNGVFASMCRESGDYEQLVEMATACHKARLLIDV